MDGQTDIRGCRNGDWEPYFCPIKQKAVSMDWIRLFLQEYQMYSYLSSKALLFETGLQ
jgi:hypothetical protein